MTPNATSRWNVNNNFFNAICYLSLYVIVINNRFIFSLLTATLIRSSAHKGVAPPTFRITGIGSLFDAKVQRWLVLLVLACLTQSIQTKGSTCMVTRIQTFLKLLKSVTSRCDEKRKQTVATLVVYLTISNIFLGTVSM